MTWQQLVDYLCDEIHQLSWQIRVGHAAKDEDGFQKYDPYVPVKVRANLYLLNMVDEYLFLANFVRRQSEALEDVDKRAKG